MEHMDVPPTLSPSYSVMPNFGWIRFGIYNISLPLLDFWLSSKKKTALNVYTLKPAMLLCQCDYNRTNKIPRATLVLLIGPGWIIPGLVMPVNIKSNFSALYDTIRC